MIFVSVAEIMSSPVKEMMSKFDRLEKFQGVDFRCWLKKMHFLLTTMKVVHVLSTLASETKEDEMLEGTRQQCKWENDDYMCRCHILNGMSDPLFDIYQTWRVRNNCGTTLGPNISLGMFLAKSSLLAILIIIRWWTQCLLWNNTMNYFAF